jgi:hypothetical protein
MDVIVHDIDKSEDLHKEVSERLNIKYLSNSAQELDEVKGELFGTYRRPFGTMTMETKGQIKNIHFLIVTGSPKTYICREVFNSFGLTISNPNETFTVRLNKRQIMANVTPDGFHFSELNILGTDYLHLYKAKLFTDYDDQEPNFIIKFNDK